MSRIKELQIILFFLLFFFSPVVNATVRVTDLQCEYLTNPLGIDVTEPRLNWKLESTDSLQRNLILSAYQILVASNEDNLEANIGDFWDTGKILSGQSVHVVYRGKPLQSRKRYYWKVRLWDDTGSVSQYSESAWWEMGLLEKTGWLAKWVSAPKVYDWGELDRERKRKEWTDRSIQVDPAPLFRKMFTLSKFVRQARVYISGVGYYEFYLNGEKVGDHVLDPAFTNYDKRVLYVTYDITNQVSQGKNVVGVILGNGWYNMHAIAVWGFDKAPWRARPTVLCQLELEYSDGSQETITSDQTWKVARGPVLFDGILNGEIYDARREQPGWATASFSDSSWTGVEIVEGPGGRLCSQILPPIKVMKTIKPVRLSEPGPGTFVFDFGQNITGWAQIKVSGPAGTEIKLKFGERINSDGTVDQKAIGAYTRQWEFQTDTYILKGEGIEIWEPRFTYHGFQYVEVTGFPGKPTLDNLSGRVVHTSFDQQGSFSCSNELLNKIQEISVRSYTNNFHGYPTDCPHREKLGWSAEGHLGAEQGLFNFNPQTAYTKWMNDFADAQLENGQLPGIVPSSGWGYSISWHKRWEGFGPPYDGAYILIPWYLYRYCGDERILSAHYDGFKRYVDFLTAHSENYIIPFGLGDWCPAKTKTSAEIVSTVYFFYCADVFSKIARILGKEQDVRKYADIAVKIKEAFNRKFYNSVTGDYAEGQQSALAFALSFDFVPPGGRRKVIDNLVSRIEKNNYLIDTGEFGAKYLLYALSDNGYADVAYKLVSRTEFPGWGNWVKQGATTIWETWDGKLSQNHTGFGTITTWFYNVLAGIRPDPETSGFKKFIIKPEIVGDLTWVKGEYNSVYGKIISQWMFDGKVLKLNVTVPLNTTATIYIPAKDTEDVKEGGKSIAKDKGVSFLRMEGERAIIMVGSGEYRFSSSDFR